jgi:polar amino acid transport system substrate-binding protein
LALAVTLAVLVGGSSGAQTPPAPPQPPIRAAVVQLEPWVLQDGADATGFYAEIWETVAKRLGRDTEWVWVGSFADVLKALEDGRADVAVAPLAPTAERETRYDFTNAVVRSGPSIGVHSRLANKQSLFGALFSAQIGKVLLGGLILLLILAHVVWLVERNDAQDGEQFRKRYPHGMWDGFWWAAVTIATVGYGDKAPKSLRGRLVGLIAILCSLFMVGAFVSQVTSTLTNRVTTYSVQSLSDLNGHSVGAVEGSTFKSYVATQGVTVSGARNQGDLFERAKAGDLDVIITNPFALDVVGKRYGVVRIGDVLYEEFETFGVAQGSPLREEINKVLADLLATGRIQQIIDRWVQ